MSARTWNTEQLTRLHHEVQRAASRPVGPHLSYPNKKRYAREELTPEEVEALDRHLISCEVCCQDVEGLLADAEAAVPATAPVAARQTAKLRKQFRVWWDGLTAAVRPIPWSFPEPGLRTGSKIIFKGKTADETLSWRGMRTKDGSLHLMLGSSASALKGASIVLKQGRFECPIEIKGVGKHVGAEIIISKSDWKRLSPGPLLHRIVLKDGTVITADNVE